MSDVLVANKSFTTDLDGVPVTVTEGVTRVRAKHPLALQNPEYFTSVEENIDFDIVEETTKVPAQKRGQHKRSAKKA